MVEQTESHKPQSKNKPLKWLIILLFIAFVLSPILGHVLEDDLLFRPNRVGHRHFRDLLRTLRWAIHDFIINEQHGVVFGHYHSFALITDKEEFVSGLQEAIFRVTSGRTTRTVRHFRRYFDNNIIKIIVHDNFLFLRVNLDKAAYYASRNPLMRSALARYAVLMSEALFEREDYFNSLKLTGRPTQWFLGSFEMNSPVLFTEEMNYLYVLIFAFNNDPPVSISEFP